MDATTAIAVWGAVAGTAAIVWDVIKWKKDGPRLKVSVSPNMQVFDHGTRQLDPRQIIQVRVVNIGTRPARVTSLLGWPFKSRLHRLLGKPAGEGFLVLNPEFSVSLPVTLAPGEEWHGYIDRKGALEVAGDAVLYCGVEYTLAKKPVLVRIDPKALRPPTASHSQPEPETKTP